MIVLLFDNSRVDVSNYRFVPQHRWQIRGVENDEAWGGLRNRLHALASRARGLFTHFSFLILFTCIAKERTAGSEQRAQRAASTASTTNTQHGAQPVPLHASPPSTVTAPRPGCPSLLPRAVALCVVPHCAATRGHRQRQRRRYSGNVARTPGPLPAGHSDNNLNDAGAADADDAHIQ